MVEVEVEEEVEEERRRRRRRQRRRRQLRPSSSSSLRHRWPSPRDFARRGRERQVFSFASWSNEASRAAAAATAELDSFFAESEGMLPPSPTTPLLNSASRSLSLWRASISATREREREGVCSMHGHASSANPLPRSATRGGKKESKCGPVFFSSKATTPASSEVHSSHLLFFSSSNRGAPPFSKVRNTP